MSRFLRVAVSALLLIACGLPLRADMPKNVILMIGDGMGFEHVKAAHYYNGGDLPFELFPYKGEVTTHSASSTVTDSAAAATAMATGQKVNNGVISVAPDGITELRTLVEIFSDRNASTGLVTTTPMTHATPAAFAAHETSRSNYTGIAADYFTQTRPNVLFGGGGPEMSTAAANGYTVVTTREGMNDFPRTQPPQFVSGQFGAGELPYEWDGTFEVSPTDHLPHLSEMTSAALNILEKDTDGFFLMVEGGLIDWAAHGNKIERTVFEVREFSDSVDVIYDWAKDRDDTLILVTADHETGGLTVTDTDGGQDPSGWNGWTGTWSTSDHTAANVPIYAWGVNANLVGGVMDNTDVFHVASVPEPATWVMFSAGLLALWWGTNRKHRKHLADVP